ncbi:hypothetical protein BRD00_07760 [Halobacteriales archaeon QS_8_69_26]|nr:MAG: hypothetical protein BRD00_07760 [Halobacteriales archaeon QS_8_69_26]
MERRRFLRGAAAAVAVGVAGCNGGGDDGSPGTTDDGGRVTVDPTPTPQPGPTTPPDPEKPDPLDAEGATAFVRATERRRTYDEIVTDDTEEVSLTCEAFHHRSAGDGHVVLTGCGGSASGGGDTVDVSGRPTFYYVGPERTVRVEGAERIDRPSDAAYAAEDDADNVDTAGGVRLYSFLDSSQRVSVEVTHLTSGDTALDEEYDLDAGSGVVVENVARRRGSYGVTVGVGDASATGGWTVTEDTVGRAVLTGTVAPGPDVGVQPARIEEIVALGPV